MNRAILGSIAKYDEFTFKKSLNEGFTLGAIEAAAQDDISAHANNKAVQNKKIAQMNAEYEESGLKLVVPTCTADTVWRLEGILDSRLQSFRSLEQLHSMSHASYYLIGYAAAGLFYGSNPDELVNNRIRRINLYYQDARVSELSLAEAIKQLPIQNQSAESFLTNLKQTLQSCHSRVTILFLAACPDNAVRIRSDREQRIIEEELRKSMFSEAYKLHDVKSCKVRDITTALRKFKPSILHFSGHASKDGLVFENEQGGFDLIDTERLSLVMKQGAKNGLQTVVLNACSTAEQSDCIANIVGCVIAMKDAVNDTASIDFMRVFYGSLAEGHEVEDAFKWASSDSELLYRPDMIRPLLITGGTKSKKAIEEAQKKPAKKGSNPVLSEGKVEVGSAQGQGLFDNPNDNRKTTLVETEVDEDESEETDDGDGNEFSSETEALGSLSLSKTAPASEDPPASKNVLALEKSSAAENALASEKVQAPASKMGGVVSPTNTTTEEKPPASDNSPATAGTASKMGGTSTAVKMKSSESEQLGLSMIEQLSLRSRLKKNEHGPNDPVLAPKSSASPSPNPSPRPILKAQAPRQASAQTGNAPKLRDTDSNRHPGVTASAGRPTNSPFHRHPLFDDPFFKDPFLGGSTFTDVMLDGFFGSHRSASAQARPAQNHGSNASNSRSEVPKAQLRPCDICNESLTMEGGLTCITCTKGKQIACASCAPRLKCLEDKHEVRLVKV